MSGRYEILSHLASGGMGKVCLAKATGPGGFERHVVLKMLELDALADDPIVEMFLDEARVVGRMHHQHIAPAYELGQDAEGNYFIVMDYIHGQTAKAVLRRALDLRSPLSIPFGLTIATATASALHYAHAHHVIHRDVSLSNLMVGYDGAVKLIDFGIAKAEARTTRTQVGQVKGKAAYMAPEQILGRPVDARTDIFALGVVLYELATMVRAFREATDEDTLARILGGQVVPPSHIVSGFPPALERVILTALEPDPAARYQEADHLRRELDAIARHEGYVLGDAVVIDTMEHLFEQRVEPWQVFGRGSASVLALSQVHDAPTEIVEEVPTEPVPLWKPPPPSIPEASAMPRPSGTTLAPPRDSSHWPWILAGIAAAFAVLGALLAQ